MGQSQGTVWLFSGGLSSDKPSLMDLCQASAILEDLQRKLIPVLLIWLLLRLLQMPELLLMLGLLLMPGLELLVPRLLLMPELLLLLELPLPDHLNWSLLNRLVFKLAE